MHGLTAPPAPNGQAAEPPPVILPPLLARAAEAARLCGMSRAGWDRLRSAGHTPAPIRLGAGVYWRVAELRDWIEAGCPPRAEWEAMRAAKK